MMLFSEFVDRLSRIARSTGRTDTTELLADLFAVASPEEARLIAYLLSGELRPQYKGQTLFGFAERSLRHLIVEFLVAVGASSADDLERALRDTDLADLVERLSWNEQLTKKLSIHEVYDRLVALTQISGTGAQAVRAELLIALLVAMRPAEVAYVLRIMLGKLRLGCADMTILDALSWLQHKDKSQRKRLEEAYNIHADIGDIVYRVKKDGIQGVADIVVTLGVPIRPAAAERLPSPEAIIERLGSCVVQPKLDGFRLQIHIAPDHAHKVFFFSRNLQSMDSMFPDLTAACVAVNDQVILDGEAISYDDDTDRYLPFQETVKRRRKHGISESAQEYPLRYVIFDLLYYQNESLLARPYHERYGLLRRFVAGLSEAARNVFVLIDEVALHDAQDLRRYFMAQVEQGFEGIVAKRDDAVYQAGKRNFNWIKLKRQQIGSLKDTIDTVVVGYYYGRGKRARFGIGACLVAVLDSDTYQYMTIAKLGTGFSDADWIALKDASDKYRCATKPAQLVCSDIVKPDVWVEPAIVVEVAADEITRSPVHTAARNEVDGYGLALRFPRAVAMRSDKNAHDATTVKEVQELFNQQTARVPD
jgi:DNA ligase-1